MRSGGEGSHEIETRLAESVARAISATVFERTPRASHRGSEWGGEQGSFALIEHRLARRDRRGRRLRLTAAMVCAAMLGAGGYRALRPADPSGARITYRVGGGLAVQEGALVASAVASEPNDVRFSDGTRMHMEPRARGRIVDLDRNGGRIALVQGKAQVDVRHRPNARWLFEAGPFEVRVHGTSFSIAWNPATTLFELQMETGVVSVAGPISGGEIMLHAGQTLSVNLGDSRTREGVTAAPLPPPGAKPVAARTEIGRPIDAVPAESRQVDTPPTRRPQRPSAQKDWRAELDDGHAGAVLADAEQRGLGHVLETASSEDLAALADAARYVGRQDLARRALHTQRRRFPLSGRAAEASFQLGRLEDESASGAAGALVWYNRYLTEAPAGAYISEALGRKMMVLERTARHEEAAAVAVDYLRRFSTGTYAHAAGVLAGSSGPAVAPRAP